MLPWNKLLLCALESGVWQKNKNSKIQTVWAFTMAFVWPCGVDSTWTSKAINAIATRRYHDTLPCTLSVPSVLGRAGVAMDGIKSPDNIKADWLTWSRASSKRSSLKSLDGSGLAGTGYPERPKDKHWHAPALHRHRMAKGEAYAQLQSKLQPTQISGAAKQTCRTHTNHQQVKLHKRALTKRQPKGFTTTFVGKPRKQFMNEQHLLGGGLALDMKAGTAFVSIFT